MNRLLSLTFIFILFMFSVLPACQPQQANAASQNNTPPFSFRNGISGGMTVDEVRALEAKESHFWPTTETSEECRLYYTSETAGGLPAHLVYTFWRNALRDAFYSFERHQNRVQAIDDFLALSEQLTTLYGAPEQQYGFNLETLEEISVGHNMEVPQDERLAFRATWLINDGSISVRLFLFLPAGLSDVTMSLLYDFLDYYPDELTETGEASETRSFVDLPALGTVPISIPNQGL